MSLMLSAGSISHTGLPHHRLGNRREISSGNNEQLVFNNIVSQLSTTPIKFLTNNEEGYGNVLTNQDKELLKKGFPRKGELEELIRKGVENEIDLQGGNTNIDIDELVDCIVCIIYFESNPCIGGQIYKAYAQLYIFGEEEFHGILGIVSKIEKITSLPSKIMTNLVNRNSIHTPLQHEVNGVLNGREVSYKVSSVLMGRYERMDMGLGKLNWFNTLVDAIIGEKDDIRNFKNVGKNGIPSYNRDVYKQGKGTSNVNMVRLKDRGAYIEEKKKELITYLKDYTITNLLYSKNQTLNDTNVINELNELFNKGYLYEPEVKKTIKIWLRNKADKVLGKITDKDLKLDSLDIGIIGWGILNGVYLEPIIKEVEKITGKNRDFFTKNIANVNYEELIFNLIIKQS